MIPSNHLHIAVGFLQLPDPVSLEPLFLNFFFCNDTATTEIYTNLNILSLHDALPIRSEEHTPELQSPSEISYAVFCFKQKKKKILQDEPRLLSVTERTTTSLRPT